MFNVEQANAFTLCFSSDGEDIQAQSHRALDSALIPASSGADSDPTSSKRSGGETGVCAHHRPSLYAHSEEVRQGLNYALRHALACTVNCVLLAITHAYKCSWQLKPRFSRYFAGGSEGLSRSKGLLFEGKKHGPKDRAELQEYIGESLARNTVDAFSDGRKY